VKTVACADRRQSCEINLRPHNAIRTQLDAFINHGIRPNPDGGIQFRFRMNDGGWMNHKFKVADSA
jgi:hypothetical protein